jgi:hypothetical protein
VLAAIAIVVDSVALFFVAIYIFLATCDCLS